MASLLRNTAVDETAVRHICSVLLPQSAKWTSLACPANDDGKVRSYSSSKCQYICSGMLELNQFPATGRNECNKGTSFWYYEGRRWLQPRTTTLQSRLFAQLCQSLIHLPGIRNMTVIGNTVSFMGMTNGLPFVSALIIQGHLEN